MDTEREARIGGLMVLIGLIAALTIGGYICLSYAPSPTAADAGPAPATYLAPHCERAAAGGTENCVWEPVADCESDEDSDDAIPAGYAGCRWDAATAGNGKGTSYVIWRRN